MPSVLEIFDQRLGEGRMPVGAVRRGFAGRRGEGEQDALGPPDAAKPGLHVLVRGDGDHAARVVGLRGIAAARAERIVAAGVEDDQPDLGDRRDGLAHIFQRQRRGLQRIERGRVGIGRQQPVVAGDLDAVAGEIDQRHIGAGAVVAKILERAAHPLEVAVGLQRHLEAKLLEHVADRLGVVDRVVELADVLVAVLADDQRHAPFGRRRAGNERQDDGTDDTQNIPTRALSRTLSSQEPWDRSVKSAWIGFRRRDLACASGDCGCSIHVARPCLQLMLHCTKAGCPEGSPTYPEPRGLQVGSQNERRHTQRRHGVEIVSP